METKIHELKLSGEYLQAINYFKTAFARENNAAEIAQKPFLVADILFCLRKTNQSAAALKFYYRFLKLSLTEHLQLKHEIVWNLLAMIKQNQYSEFRNEALQMATTLQPQRDKWAFSLYFFKLIQTEIAQKNTEYHILLSLLKNIKPEKLEAVPTETEINGKKQTLNSELEKYYLLYSKLLIQQKQYTDCIQLLSQIPTEIRPANVFWLNRTKALALAHSGETQKATEMLLQQIQPQTAWFIYLDLYRISEPKLVQRPLYLMLSLMLPGMLDFRIKALEALAKDIFFDVETQAMAQALAKQIRLRNQWVKSDEIAHPPKSILQDYKAFVSKLERLMQANKWLQNGQIIRILHKGMHGDGFCAKAGKKWYFKRQNVLNTDKKRELSETESVLFIIGTSTYNGENREIAQWIWIAENNQISWPAYSFSLNKIPK